MKKLLKMLPDYSVNDLTDEECQEVFGCSLMELEERVQELIENYPEEFEKFTLH